MNEFRGVERLVPRQPASQIDFVDDYEPDVSIDLRAVLELLRRRLRLIVVTALLCVGLVGVAVLTLPPIYSSTTLLMVDPSRKDLLEPELHATGSGSENARLDSEVELVKSEATLIRVISDLNLITDEEFGLKLGLKDRLMAFLRIAEPKLPTGNEAIRKVLSNLSSHLTVQRKGLTYLITIQARSLDPEKSAHIANAVADAYIRQQLEGKIQATVTARDVLRAQIDASSTAVARSEEALDTFIENSVETISRDGGRTDLTSLRDQLNQLDSLTDSYKSKLDLTDRSLAARDWTTVARELGTEAVLRLEQQRTQLLNSLSSAAEGSERSIDLRAELQGIEAELEGAAESELLNLRREVSASEARTADARQRLRESVLKSQLPATLLTNIYSLQQTAEIARSQYQTMLARLSDLDTQSSLQIADSRVASAALPPNDPTFPNATLMLSVAAVVGLGLGVAAAFLVENYVGGFTSEAQLRSVLKTQTVPAVPRQRRSGPETAIPSLIVGSPLAVFSESIRRIRVGLDQAARKKNQGASTSRSDGTVIMVTSAEPNEGKTTVALSLARAYSVAGRSTLLIDCDLRKPGVHKLLGIESRNGLLDYLADPAVTLPLASITIADQESGAQIILGTGKSAIATDQLVTGETFARLVKAARERFDVVILDTPPVGPVVDGLYLAHFADVIAFVVRWAVTSQHSAREAVAGLVDNKSSDTEIVAILNQQDLSRNAYRSRYAGYYNEA